MIRPLCLFALALTPSLSAQTASGSDAAPQADLPRVLFLTHSAGFTHGVVNRQGGPAALAEVQLAAALNGRFLVDATQDCADINAENLESYAAVAFYTTGELPIADEDLDAFFAWIHAGGGFIGIHSGSDTYYQEPRYLELVGGYFDGHPWHQRIGATVEDVGHPATRHLDERWVLTDEIYQFRSWQRSRLYVLLSLDPNTVEIDKGKREDGDYGLAWCRNHGEGRMFYTALGHRPEVWRDQRYLRHLMGGVSWAAGLVDWQVAPPAGAQVIIGENGVDGMQHRDGRDLEWTVAEDGSIEVKQGTGDALTRASFGDFTAHIEFRIPQEPDNRRGQARGNSGVYLQDRYEVQVLDSYGLEQGMGDCGSIYGVKIADSNASRAPLVWQTYDIHYQAPRYDPDGNKTASARATVYHNGILIHEDVEIPRSTAGGQPEAAGDWPIRLQDHGNLVRYRNFWVLPR